MNHMMGFGCSMTRNYQAGGQRESGGGWREWAKRQTHLRSLGEFKNLRSFQVSERVHQAVLNKDVSKLDEIGRISGPLNKDNYLDTLETLLSIDEAHNAISMRKFDMFKQRLTITFTTDEDEDKKEEEEEAKGVPKLLYYGILVEGLSNGQPNLIPNDIVIMKDPYDEYKMFTIKGFKDDLVLLSNQQFDKYEDFLRQELDIYFTPCGLIYNYYKKAFERLPSLRQRIFEEGETSLGQNTISITESSGDYQNVLDEKLKEAYGRLKEAQERLEEPEERLEKEIELLEDARGRLEEADERLEKLNEPQRQAVVNILKNEYHPKPYFLFGPPGTGKTHTLVEAIAQIYARSKAKILFCANSNTCADQTIEKLKKIDFIRSFDIVRLAARDGTLGICSSRIIVTTNVKSSSLMEEYEFDYVFIDEAGHAHEPETLLPICSLKPDGCLVMAGDPKQLGPVVQCEQAAEYGLERSMFERIFKFDIYKRDRETNKYDEKFITKLLISYRCDERILAISNKLFYHNELECPNGTPTSILRIMNLSNPLQFCNVNGNEYRLPNSTSWRNNEEAERVVDLIVRLYKMGFEPSQIGVMSPYKLQTKLIAKEVKERLDRGLRYMLETRFEEKRTELIKKKKKKASCEADSGHVENIEFDLEKLKLGETEEFSLDDQNKEKADELEEDEYETVEKIVKRKDEWLCKIDSVDAFQGNEREIIIISTVRTPSSGRKDFIDEPRRFNVALSRAKWLVFVVGHQHILDHMSNWGEFMSRCGKESSKWPKQSIVDAPFKQENPLFRDYY